jgi:hypothetical protein
MLSSDQVDQLLCTIQSPDVRERRKAAAGLGGSSDPRAVQALMRACGDPEVSVKSAALAALRDSHAPEVTQFLQARGMRVAAPATAESTILNSRALRKMSIGAVFLVGGGVITGITYAHAANSPTGGTYVVFWGAIIFGFFDLVWGAYAYWKASRRY